MTHTGDGDVPDDGRRKRRRRRRGRRGKNGSAGATSPTVSDANGASGVAASATGAVDGSSAGAGASHQPSASRKRKSRSRRRRSGARASGAQASGAQANGVQANGVPVSSAPAGGAPASGAPTETSPAAPPSGAPPSGAAPVGAVTSEHAPQGKPRSRNAKRARHGRASGTSRQADPRRGTDGAVSAPEAASVKAVERGEVASERPSEADALAARRARADRETSAGGIVYRVQNGEALFLIIRDSYRNWGFPKGHLEGEELPDEAAIREVQEETGLVELQLDGAIETIDWFFRFRGRLVHKVCHFYLMRTENSRTVPQREEGITACRWARFEEATRLISYANARSVLSRANAMVLAGAGEPDGAVTGAGGNAGARTNANAADAARG